MKDNTLEKLKYAELWLKYAETSHDQVFKGECKIKAYHVLIDVGRELGYIEEKKK